MRRHILALVISGIFLAGVPAAVAEEVPGPLDRLERSFLDLRIWLWPDDPNVRLARANLLYHLEELDAALADYDRAIALQPSPAAHMRRAQARSHHPDDRVRKGAYDDLAAVLVEMPGFDRAIDMRATMRIQDGAYDEGIAEIDTLLESYPDADMLMRLRGDLSEAAGRSADMRDMLVELAEKQPSPSLLNHLCWVRVTRNIELQEALENCDAALAEAPEFAEALDSRGVVLLRLGRPAEAIAAFNMALAKEPDMAPSLYMRGLARLWLARKDPAEAALAEADLQAALELDPEVEEDYQAYGLTRQWATGG
ncbi:tetratricopeptide repeat protein [Niveispirillum sp. SYP-B3756]|uniref:tetratricopeptide repeat protein n=1 Tax=Niveispirillum sp. SYP-B3756 TaxID=2662178 RepID=UPI0015653EB6|nr:tetratricopeptide repeat protein [Niveispirillum sp. SYP-B3756]